MTRTLSQQTLSVRIDQWLAKRQTMVLALLVGAAVLIRLVFYLQFTLSPAISQHTWQDSDMNFFHEWAVIIEQGDWLSDRELHPFHIWHADIARAHFSRHSPRVLESPEQFDEAAKALWRDWYGGKQFHQSPLYPYLVAISYRLFGHQIKPVIIAQLLLGIVSIILVYLISRQHFGNTTAVVAAILLILFGPGLFYESVMLRVTLITTILLAAVYLIDQCLTKPDKYKYIALGLLLGLGLVAKTVFVFLVAGALGLVFLQMRRRALPWLKPVGAITIGISLVLAPVVARNLLVGAPTFGLSSVGPVSYATANSAGNPFSQLNGFVVTDVVAAEIMHQSEGQFGAAVAATFASHASPSGFFYLQWEKLLALLHWYEVPNNVNFYYYEDQISILKFLPVRFILLASLGIAGILLAAGSYRKHASLYLLVLTTLASVMLVQTLSRYKIPIAVALLPFASYTLTRVGRWIERRRFSKAAVVFAMVGILLVFISRPLPDAVPRVRDQDILVWYQLHYFPQYSKAIEHRQWNQAADILELALSSLPRSRFLPDREAPRPGKPGSGLVEELIQAYYVTANLTHKPSPAK